MLLTAHIHIKKNTLYLGRIVSQYSRSSNPYASNSSDTY